jgi:MoaA/NifB/PqqE/SkfB family radical SAM enzyme
MAIPIDFMLTAKCNLQCPFCYGPDPHIEGELSLPFKRRLIEELAMREVSHIVFAGGEPLMSPDAADVISRTKELGISVGLQTNAFFPERLRAVLPYLDWVAFPIDGCDSKTQQLLRTSASQLDRTKAAVELFRSLSEASTKLKIGTVVTPYNIDELPRIANQVKLLQPDIWKWYQVRPRGAGQSNFETLTVARSDIERSLIQIESEHPNLNIFVSYVEQSINAYLIVNPDSEALVPQVDSYISAGHLLKRGTTSPQFDDFVWDKFLAQRDAVAQEANMKNSFPNWLEGLDL